VCKYNDNSFHETVLLIARSMSHQVIWVSRLAAVSTAYPPRSTWVIVIRNLPLSKGGAKLNGSLLSDSSKIWPWWEGLFIPPSLSHVTSVLFKILQRQHQLSTLHSTSLGEKRRVVLVEEEAEAAKEEEQSQPRRRWSSAPPSFSPLSAEEEEKNPSQH